MNSSPFVTEHCRCFIEGFTNSRDGWAREAIILSQHHGDGRTIKIEHRLIASREDMHVCRNVVSWIDHDVETVVSQHKSALAQTNPKRLGFQPQRPR